jgi:hypothetical protein
VVGGADRKGDETPDEPLSPAERVDIAFLDSWIARPGRGARVQPAEASTFAVLTTLILFAAGGVVGGISFPGLSGGSLWAFHTHEMTRWADPAAKVAVFAVALLAWCQIERSSSDVELNEDTAEHWTPDECEGFAASRQAAIRRSRIALVCAVLLGVTAAIGSGYPLWWLFDEVGPVTSKTP